MGIIHTDENGNQTVIAEGLSIDEIDFLMQLAEGEITDRRWLEAEFSAEGKAWLRAKFDEITELRAQRSALLGG